MVKTMDMPIGTTTTRCSSSVRSRNILIHRKTESKYMPSRSLKEVAPVLLTGTASSLFGALVVSCVNPSSKPWNMGWESL
eukprot:4731003-Pyramimonas_sp.AAC.1